MTEKTRKKLNIIQIVLILLWGGTMINCEAYYINYLLVFIGAIFCSISNLRCKKPAKTSKRGLILISFFTAFFTGIILISNLGLMRPRYNLIALTLGSISVFCNIFKYLSRNISSLKFSEEKDSSKNAKKIFLTLFLILAISRILLLFLSYYPGIVTSDTVDQLTQMQTGNYHNHHPVYHTQFMHFFINIGTMLTGSLNVGIAVYSVFQILLSSAIFSLAVSTMARMKAPKWVIILSSLFFVLTPFHILYSFTLWKDVVFGLVILTLVIFTTRYILKIGSEKINLILLAISGIGIYVFRTNGVFVYILALIAALIIWRLKDKKLIIALFIALLSGFAMKNVLLKVLNVKNTDTVESLSIPVQQVARVISDGGELKDSEKELIGEVIDIEKVPEEYLAHISDPIKMLIRQKKNQNNIIEKKWDYIGLYLSLGLRYPGAYVRAYVDETKGYYNSGYDYWRWVTWFDTDNDLGLEERHVVSEKLNDTLDVYYGLFENVQILKPLVSIGLYTWAYLALLFIALVRKDKLGIFIVLPTLFVILSLMIATPVFAEFRYAYSSFTVMPFAIAVVFRPQKESKNIKK